MKRVAIPRGTVWKRPRPIVRPGVTPKLPKTWQGLARAIRKRDGGMCRRCGQPAPGGPVDHVLPRRLLVGSEIAARANLALLCNGVGSCHSFKTMVLEPRLFRGDILAFNQYLRVIAASGPIPSTSLKARAFQRLREAMYGAQVPSA